MHKKILFPQIDGFIHGGDYNPDQWLNYPDILEKDIEMFKKAHINCVTMGVFSWSSYERREGEYDFSWLVDMIKKLYANGIYTILATPSGARPAWFDKKYPEVRRVRSNHIREEHRERHNHCPSSPVFRNKITELDTKLAEAVKDLDGVILWHISNEFEGDCFCPLCAERFREFLKDRYHNDIEELNEQYWTGFWSKRFNDFDEIDAPFDNGENALMGLLLDWRRFTTYNVTDYMKVEIEAVKKVTPDIPVTTNMMNFFPAYDYRVMAKELDVISWDAYPRFHNDYESLFDTFQDAGFTHALMRSLKKKPFMLMESTPGQVNWQPFNKPKKPGVHPLMCMQTVANGSDTVQYFQLRQSRGAYEQFHSAVISHSGKDDTRIFKDVTKTGEDLIDTKELIGTINKAEVALVVDWDTRWALWYTQAFNNEDKGYEKTVKDFYKLNQKLGTDTDIISQYDNFDEYKVIVAPMMFLLENGTAEKIRRYVENGGTFIATYISGYVNENTLAYLGGFPGDGLMEVFGLENEEIDTLWPKQSNCITLNNRSVRAYDYCEIIKTDKAEVLASYTDDWYKGYPAITVNRYGKGKAYYIATRTDASDLKELFMDIYNDKKVSFKTLPENVEYHLREDDKNTYEFYLNESEDEVKISGICGYDLISKEELKDTLTLKAYKYAVIKNSK